MPAKESKSTAQKLIQKLKRLKKSYVHRDEFLKKWGTLREQLYRTPEYRDFLLEARTRAGFRCERCPSKGRIEVHHKVRVYDNPDLSLDPDNAEVLCITCHDKEHSQYGPK